MLEHRIQSEIRLWCGEHGYPCFRCNVGTVRTETGAYFDTGLPEGFPDLIAFAGPLCLFIECKSKKGRQRDAQRRFQDAMEAQGCEYVIARGIEDVRPRMEALRAKW